MSSGPFELHENSAAQLHQFLGSVLDSGNVPASVLLESLYYASEPELFSTVRALAALDPSDRERVLAYAQHLLSVGQPSAFQSEPPTIRQ